MYEHTLAQAFLTGLTAHADGTNSAVVSMCGWVYGNMDGFTHA
jgi:hypothetical protein